MAAAASSSTTPLPQLKLKPTTSQISTFPAAVSYPSICAQKTIPLTAHLPPSKPRHPPPATDRVFNFAAGPAILPENVLLKARSELYNWRGSGMSVVEMSHRGKEFLSIIQKAESGLLTHLNIPSNYHVLFLHGGTTTQFAAIPINICQPDDVVDYVVTGDPGATRLLKKPPNTASPNPFGVENRINAPRSPASKHLNRHQEPSICTYAPTKQFNYID